MNPKPTYVTLPPKAKWWVPFFPIKMTSLGREIHLGVRFHDLFHVFSLHGAQYMVHIYAHYHINIIFIKTKIYDYIWWRNPKWMEEQNIQNKPTQERFLTTSRWKNKRMLNGLMDKPDLCISYLSWIYVHKIPTQISWTKNACEIIVILMVIEVCIRTLRRLILLPNFYTNFVYNYETHRAPPHKNQNK